VTVTTASPLDGRALRDEMLAELRATLDAAGRPAVTLGTVLVGADESARWAMRAKHDAADDVGIRTVGVDLPATATQEEVEREVARLAGDPTIHGIFVQLPLPAHVDAARIVELIPPERDIDGLTPDSPFTPASALAVLHLLARLGVDTTGRHVVIVGDSPYVAAPLARLLTGRASVTRVDAEASDIVEVCRRADIVVSAVADAGLITPAHVGPGTTIIDVPTPGGVGPVTIAILLTHTARAAGVGH